MIMIAVIICLLIAINVNGQTCPSDAISTLATGDRDLSIPLTSPACFSCAYIAGFAIRYFTDVTWTRRRSGVNTLLTNGTGGVLIGPSTDTPDPTNTLILNNPSVVIAVGDELRCDSAQARAAGHSTGEHLIFITAFTFLNPLISPINGTINIVEGSNLTLNCDDPGNTGFTSYQWFNVTGTELSNRETTPPAVLTFNNIQRTSSGIYICRSSKTIGIKDSNVTINVQYAAQPWPRNVFITPTYDASKITLTCSANDAANYQWIDISTGQIVSNNSIIYISTMSNKIGGQYRCIATNEVGSINAVIKGTEHPADEDDNSQTQTATTTVTDEE